MDKPAAAASTNVSVTAAREPVFNPTNRSILPLPDGAAQDQCTPRSKLDVNASFEKVSARGIG